MFVLFVHVKFTLNHPLNMFPAFKVSLQSHSNAIQTRSTGKPSRRELDVEGIREGV